MVDTFDGNPEAKSAPAVPIESGIEVAGHTRLKRGRKPLDPALPREIVRHELPASERICPHDDADLVFGDETVIQVLKESGRAAQSKSYLWAQMNGTGPPVRLFG